jgi:hypothetical protein
MSRLAAFLLLLAAFAIAAPIVAVASPVPQPCDIPAPFTDVTRPIEPLSRAIAEHRRVTILAIGSAATAGSGTGPADSGFPRRMLAALREAQPRVDFSLAVRGGRGMTAVQMLPLIEDELTQAPPTVVLWQTGTVEAVRGMRADRMRRALQTGVEEIREAGASLVLIDPLFTRTLRANADVEPYETELQQVASQPGAWLFRRYDLTRGWVLSGKIDPERAETDERGIVLDRLNACLGDALARYLLNGARVTAP